ncbi:MAG: hypothetical protein QM784_04445 [Polyangiaceae bacterium]
MIREQRGFAGTRRSEQRRDASTWCDEGDVVYANHVASGAVAFGDSSEFDGHDNTSRGVHTDARVASVLARRTTRLVFHSTQCLSAKVTKASNTRSEAAANAAWVSYSP